MVVDAGAEEAGQLVQVPVPGGQPAQLGRHLLLGVGPGQVEVLGAGAEVGGDGLEQLLDVVEAEGLQHPVDVLTGVGLVAQPLLLTRPTRPHGTFPRRLPPVGST